MSDRTRILLDRYGDRITSTLTTINAATASGRTGQAVRTLGEALDAVARSEAGWTPIGELDVLSPDAPGWYWGYWESMPEDQQVKICYLDRLSVWRGRTLDKARAPDRVIRIAEPPPLPKPPVETHQVRGGIARAESLTPERRSEIARQAALSRWNKTEQAS